MRNTIRMPKLLAGVPIKDAEQGKWFLVRNKENPSGNPTLCFHSPLNGKWYTLTEEGGVYELLSSDYYLVCEVDVSINVSEKK